MAEYLVKLPASPPPPHVWGKLNGQTDKGEFRLIVHPRPPPPPLLILLLLLSFFLNLLLNLHPSFLRFLLLLINIFFSSPSFSFPLSSHFFPLFSLTISSFLFSRLFFLLLFLLFNLFAPFCTTFFLRPCISLFLLPSPFAYSPSLILLILYLFYYTFMCIIFVYLLRIIFSFSRNCNNMLTMLYTEKTQLLLRIYIPTCN
jgi:hypothetical protein